METSVRRTNYIWPAIKLIAAILTAVVTITFVILQNTFAHSGEPDVTSYSVGAQFLFGMVILLPILIIAIIPLSILADYLIAVKCHSKVQKVLGTIFVYLSIAGIAGILYSIFITSPTYGSSIVYFVIITFIFLAFQTFFNWIALKNRH